MPSIGASAVPALSRVMASTCARGLGVVDPLAIKLIGARGYALITLAGVGKAGVTAVQQREQRCV